MKFPALIGGVCVSLVLAACGGSSTTAQSSSNAANSTAGSENSSGEQGSGSAPTEVAGMKTPPKVRVPQGPPPKGLVVNDLRKGPGAAVEPGKTVRVQFVGVSYKTGKPFETDWGKTGSFSYTYGSGEAIKGWEIGLKGVRVGGLRELIIPSKLAYNTGTLVYVLEPIAIE